MKKNIIWSNLDVDYDDWKSEYKDHCEMNCIEYDESNLCSWVDETLSMYLEDERRNLHEEVDGYIVCMATIGTWQGPVTGAKVVGSKINDILYDSSCDMVEWYCDRYNVKFEGIHHDGRNRYLYRVAKSKEEADRLVDAIAYHDMSEEQFRKRTRSLRPYIKKVYGFK